MRFVENLKDIYKLATKGLPKPPLGEKGATGTKFYYGIITDEDYLEEFTNIDDTVEIYDKMSRSDGTVNAMLKASILPIVNAQWDVDYEEDDKIREIIYEGLFNSTSRPWLQTLKEILTMLEFGWSMFEIVWEIRDGLVMPKKLAPRMQNTFSKWEYKKGTNELEGMTQEVVINENPQHRTIPIEKMIMFIHDQKGDNYHGQSILRTARKDYKMKLLAEKGGIMTIQRWGVGIARAKVTDSAIEITSDVKSDLEKTGRGIQMHSRSYILQPYGIEFDILTPQGKSGGVDVIPTCMYHKNEMISSILADFLLLGKSAVGSRALSDPQMNFFLSAVNSVAQYVCDTLNRFLIKKWVDYNWKVKTYPKVTVSGIENTDLKQLSEILKNLLDSGAVRKDTQLYAKIRELFGLGEEDLEEIEQQEAQKETQKQDFLKKIQPSPDDEEEQKEAKAGEIVFCREPTEFEKSILNLDEIRDGISAFEKNLSEIVNKWQRKQKDQLARDIANRPIDKIDSVSVRWKNMDKDIFTILNEAYRFGRVQVGKELQKTLGKKKELQEVPKITTEEEALKLLEASSYILAKNLSERLHGSAISQARRIAGVEDIKEIERNIIKHLDELSTGVLSVEITKAINQAFAKGRQVEAYSTVGVKKARGSSLMDACQYCLSNIDGKTWPMGQEPQLPYSRCQGFDLCRCLMIYS